MGSYAPSSEDPCGVSDDGAQFLIFDYGMSPLAITPVRMLGGSEPVAAALISWLRLGALFTLFDLAGFVLTTAMVLVVTRSEGAGGPAS